MRTAADKAQVNSHIDGLAKSIKAQMSAIKGDWALVGIRSRGDVIAKRIAEKLGSKAVDGRVGSLDITLYRDDLSEIGAAAVVRTSDIPFSVDGLQLVLVDDVLMTGRSIRAALQSLMDLGRPKRIWLAVLVDRGGRELPIRADFVALDLVDNSEANEQVDVKLEPTDDTDAIVIRDRTTQKGAAT